MPWLLQVGRLASTNAVATAALVLLVACGVRGAWRAYQRRRRRREKEVLPVADPEVGSKVD